GSTDDSTEGDSNDGGSNDGRIGLDAGPSAIQEFDDFMKRFIIKYTLKCVTGQELIQKNVNKRKIL
ncbi:9899_t:CDS:2, partial [Racocetra persica]